MKRTLEEFKKQYEMSRDGASRLERIKMERDALLVGAREQAKLNSARKLDTRAAESFKFGVISDLHFGSRYEAIAALRAFFCECEKRGVEHILCCGDILDGWKMYAGQEYELHAFGFEEQLDWFFKNVPKVKIPVHFITGNHDASFKKLAGVDVGTIIESRLDTWKYLGEDYCVVSFGSKREWKVLLMHPDGGCAYALSYRPQRIVEQLEGGTKPNMVCIGHYHKAEFIPSYRNVAVVQAGTFQHQTPYMKRKGVSAHTGGWFINVALTKDTNIVSAEFMSFYA